jgi:hypothetical protein
MMENIQVIDFWSLLLGILIAYLVADNLYLRRKVFKSYERLVIEKQKTGGWKPPDKGKMDNVVKEINPK